MFQYTHARKVQPMRDFLGEISPSCRAALEHAGITSLTLLAAHSEREIIQLHGMRMEAVEELRRMLACAGLSFKGSWRLHYGRRVSRLYARRPYQYDAGRHVAQW